MEKVIEASGLTKRYGTFTAVDQLDLNIERGEVYGLLGPNGAGKSTTILMLLGMTEPDAGIIRVCGIDPVRDPIQVKKKVGYLPEDVGFYEDYTGLENLIYTARLNGITKEEARTRAGSLFVKVGLAGEENKKVGTYSRGMRQRLGLADVLIKEPEVVIMDEPTLGIDPAGIRAFLELIVELSRKEKIAVLFSSHHLHQVQQVCDRVGIFVKGKLLAEGPIEELSRQLFSKNKVRIEGEVLPGQEGQGDPESGWINILKALEGVAGVSSEGTRFFIEAERDITPQVARTLVEAGYGLNALKKKVFGLDEIYHRYFQDAVNI